MKVTEAAFVQGFIRMCDDGFKQNWHERNGGNLSYRIKPAPEAAWHLPEESKRDFGFHPSSD